MLHAQMCPPRCAAAASERQFPHNGSSGGWRRRQGIPPPPTPRRFFGVGWLVFFWRRGEKKKKKRGGQADPTAHIPASPASSGDRPAAVARRAGGGGARTRSLAARRGRRCCSDAEPQTLPLLPARHVRPLPAHPAEAARGKEEAAAQSRAGGPGGGGLVGPAAGPRLRPPAPGISCRLLPSSGEMQMTSDRGGSQAGTGEEAGGAALRKAGGGGDGGEGRFPAGLRQGSGPRWPFALGTRRPTPPSPGSRPQAPPAPPGAVGDSPRRRLPRPSPSLRLRSCPAPWAAAALPSPSPGRETWQRTPSPSLPTGIRAHGDNKNRINVCIGPLLVALLSPQSAAKVSQTEGLRERTRAVGTVPIAVDTDPGQRLWALMQYKQ